MSQLFIVTTPQNSGDGTPISTAFNYTNSNFSELYARYQTAVPVTLIGTTGDVPGMYATDSTYFYYCFAAYNGTNTIWAQVAQIGDIQTSQIQNGSSNVVVAANAGVTVSVGGISNVALFTTTGVSVAGGVNASGNIRGGYILGNGSQLTGLPATYSDSNVVTLLSSYGANNISTTGAITGGSVTGSNLYTAGVVSATGNVRGANLNTSGNVVVARNVLSQGVVSALGNIETSGYFVGTFVGNVTGNFVVPGSNTQVIFNTSGSADATAGMTFDKDGPNLFTVLGTISSQGNIIGGNVNTVGQLSAAGNIRGGNILTSGTVNVSGAVSATGGLNTAGTVSATGTVTVGNLATGGTISSTGNVTGGNLITAGVVSATGNINTTGNISGGNLRTGNIAVTSNISATNFTGTSVSATGNISGGNLRTGNIAVTSNISATNFTGTSVSATGNISGGYILGNISFATGGAFGYNNSSVATFLSGFGSNNISTTGSVDAAFIVVTGSYTGASLSVTGDIVGRQIEGTGILSTGNILGNLLIGALDSTAQNSITAVGTLGSLSVTNTIQGGNLQTGGSVSASGNITGGNITTGGSVSADGNITTGGNIIATNNAVANIGSSTNQFNTVFAQATSAQYADLAENYRADAEYEAGTVVVFGGSAEITTTTQFANVAVAGAISTNPAYLMNSGEDGLPVALRGRTPVKVIGPVYKGDLLVTADADPGYAVSVGRSTEHPLAVFAKSIETNTDEGVKVITAVIV